MRDSDVVITGAGCVGPLGFGLDELTAALRTGRSAIAEIASFDTGAYPCRFAAQVRDFDLARFIESSKTYIDRTSAFTLAACASALKQAGWQGDETVGLVLGTAWGCWDSLELFAEKLVTGNPRFVPPLPFTHSYANAPNSLASIEFKLHGFNACFTNGHVSGADAIEYAARRIALGREERLLAGGAESLSEPIFHAYCLKGQLNAEGRPRPYDPASMGMVLGEGSAILALERAAPAAQRGAKVLARVCGSGSCRGETLAEGLARSMEQALRDAEMEPAAVDMVLGIGCGVPAIDGAEVEAIGSVFGSARPAVASIKGLVGEAMGAGGAMSLAAALCCLEGGFVPPGALGEGKAEAIRTVLVNAADPSGACVSLVIARP